MPYLVMGLAQGSGADPCPLGNEPFWTMVPETGTATNYAINNCDNTVSMKSDEDSLDFIPSVRAPVQTGDFLITFRCTDFYGVGSEPEDGGYLNIGWLTEAGAQVSGSGRMAQVASYRSYPVDPFIRLFYPSYVYFDDGINYAQAATYEIRRFNGIITCSITADSDGIKRSTGGQSYTGPVIPIISGQESTGDHNPTWTLTNFTYSNSPSIASPFIEDFDDNSRGSMWTEFGGTVVEQNQQLEIPILASSLTVSGYEFNYDLSGDFDLSVTVDCTGVDVSVYDDRIYGGMNLTIGGFTYLIYFGDLGTENTMVVWTSDPAGTSFSTNQAFGTTDVLSVRVTRVGSTMTSYYDSGSGWTFHSSYSTAPTTNVTYLDFKGRSQATTPPTDQLVVLDDVSISGTFV